MTTFLNQNLKNEPDYFYRVTEFVTTFGMDKNKNEPFNNSTEFKGNDLLKCRNEAEVFYRVRLEGLNSGQYFLPFEKPDNFNFGEHATFSITLFFVESYNANEEIEYPILGEDPEEMEDSLEIEKFVLKEKGFL